MRLKPISTHGRVSSARKVSKPVFVLNNGPVLATIIEVADQESVDLIAMASHVRSGLSHVFYGSAAIGVLHRVDRSLRIIRSR
jgi:nucleotide-binding universal stress UspA family protein